jgi:hypothetical protein
MNPQDAANCFVRHRMLGSEAVYELLEQGDETSTAVVVHAPGLAAGARIRLLTSAISAMERVPAPESALARAPRYVPPLAA